MRLVADNVTFHYPGRKILDDVTFEACEGKVTTIIGPNGSGKSTLLRCFAKVLAPKAGVVTLGGVDISAMDRRELAKVMGFVPQMAYEAFPVTVFEAVLLGRKPHMKWKVSAKDKAAAVAALEKVGMLHLADRLVNQLSGGERQKVMFARALAQEPRTFLLDEPTSSLDIRYQLEVLGVVRSLAVDMGCTVVMVIHDLNLASRYSDSVILLKEGEVYAAGAPKDVMTNENIEAVYQVSVEVVEGAYGPSVVPLAPVCV